MRPAAAPPDNGQNGRGHHGILYDFLLVTLTPAAWGTEAGIFPLGSGDDRLTLPVVGHWKMRDNSLSSTGQWPGGTVRLAPPPVTDQLVDDTLAAAGVWAELER